MNKTKQIILERERVECLVKNLTEMLNNESYFKFELQLDSNKIIVIPYVQPCEIVI
jgi:hypothetical protein